MDLKNSNDVLATLPLVIAGSLMLGSMGKAWGNVLTVVSPHEPPPMVVFSAAEEQYNGVTVKSHEEAAVDLCDYLGRVTGRDIRPGNDVPGARVTIHVGPDDFVLQHAPEVRDLYGDGFVMKHVTVEERHHLILSGIRSFSSRWAVEEFLKQFAGVRWLFPEEGEPKYGETVPSRPTITVDFGLDQKHEPDYLNRSNCQMYFYNNTHTILSEAITTGKGLRLRPFDLTPFGSHTLQSIFDREDFKAHPEWFPLFTAEQWWVDHITNGSYPASKSVRDALARGVRRQRWHSDPGNGWQICFSHPDTVPHAVAYAHDYLAKNPESLIVSMGHNDGNGWCECSKCAAFARSVDPPYTDAEQYWHWVNRVAQALAKTHPDKPVATIAYGRPATPPRFPLEKNVCVTVTVVGKGHLDLIEQWQQKCDSINLYSYAYGWFFVGFRHYPHAMRDFLKWGRDELGAISHVSEVYGNWSFDGPKYHYMQALMWDVDAEPDQIMQEYCHDWFGAAAGPMKVFWDRLEQVYERRGHPRRLLFYQWLGWNERYDEFDDYTLDDIAALDSAIAQAEHKADTEADQFRVVRIANTWKYYRTFLLGKLNYADREPLVLDEAAQSLDRALDLARGLAELQSERLSFFRQLKAYPRINPQLTNDNYWFIFEYVPAFSDMRTMLDDLCDRITDHLVDTAGKDKALAFWQQLRPDDPLAASAGTQIYRLQHPRRGNVLANGGFETVDLSGWEVTGDMRGSERPRTGKYAASGKGTLSQTISVKPGQRYRLTARGRYQSVPEPGALLFSTDIRFRRDGRNASPEPHYRRRQEVGTPGGWEQLTTTCTVPPQAETATVFLRSRQTPVSWDDIILEIIQAAPNEAVPPSIATDP